MNQPFKFNKLPSNLTYFNKLPYDLHRYIYGFIYTAVINSIFHDYNWFEIFEFIGYSYSYEYLIEKINHLLPNKTNKFLITNSDMYSVGFYEEKVKASIWGRRYIWIEDCINEENTINLLIEKIDDYVRSIDYNEDLDQIVISSRNMSEFYVIVHSTTTEEASGHSGGNCGMGGDIL